jgi:hypothetical protein
MRLTLDDLLGMSQPELRAIVDRGHPLVPEAMAGHDYHGVDLSLPPLVNRLLWKTFRKSFVRCIETGEVRGWNTRMEQTGLRGDRVPKRRRGEVFTFAHYVVRPAAGHRFPRGWAGGHFLDYGVPGSPFGENLGWTPLVAVNEGDMSLLLGWEVFKLGGVLLPLPDFWALEREGPVSHVAARPC